MRLVSRVAPNMEVLDTLAKLAAALVAWVLVVLGWAVVNDLAAQRDRRKRDEERIDRLRNSLSEIEELALKHHGEGFDEARARSIAKKVKNIGVECSHLERLRVISNEWRFASISVKRAVTMKNFEASTYRARSSSDELLLAVEDAFNRFQVFLMRSLEQKGQEEEPLRKTLWRMVRRM